MKRERTFYDEVYAAKSWCEARAKDAKNNGCWINYKQSWYTPDEFVKEAHGQDNYFHPQHTNFEMKHVKIKDPRGIIPRLDARLQHFKNLRDQFVNKVEEYYRKK